MGYNVTSVTLLHWLHEQNALASKKRVPAKAVFVNGYRLICPSWKLWTVRDEFFEACSGSEIKVSEVFIWGGIGLPKCGDAFYFVAVGPVIPRRVALQQSPLPFHWTKRVCVFGSGDQFRKRPVLIPCQQTERAVSQMGRLFFCSIALRAGFHTIGLNCWRIQTQPGCDSPARCAGVFDCKRLRCNRRAPGEAGWHPQTCGGKSAPV